METRVTSASLIGKSPKIEAIRKLIEKLKNSKTNVLIIGETGTGKEVVAKLISQNQTPFIAVDSSTIQSSTAESILFGHIKGAFTGADQYKKGIFEEASGGTVYFDEISNMCLSIQAKLLRVIQEQEAMPVGAAKTVKLSFRVIAASNQNLDNMVANASFKADLLQRLKVITVALPPLRERKEDIPELTKHFCKIHGRELEFTKEAQQYLANYNWPGNVRELSNLILNLVTLSESSTIDVTELPDYITNARIVTQETSNEYLEELEVVTQSNPRSLPKSFYDIIEDYERKILLHEFEKRNGNISRLARELGMDRSHLYDKLKKYSIYLGKNNGPLESRSQQRPNHIGPGIFPFEEICNAWA
jgi:DNA-binding NtrC family response regulator